MERKGNCTLGGEQVGAKEGNQSGGQTVTLLVLPLNGFWLGFERQRLEASTIEELAQVLSMEKLLPPRVTTQAMFTTRIRIRIAEQVLL